MTTRSILARNQVFPEAIFILILNKWYSAADYLEVHVGTTWGPSGCGAHHVLVVPRTCPALAGKGQGRLPLINHALAFPLFLHMTRLKKYIYVGHHFIN